MLQHVVRSTVIDAPIDRVWAVLRDFNSHDRWHDVVAESRIEGDERSDQVGCVRSFTLKRRQPHPRAADRALRQRAQEHLLHRRGDRAAAALRRDGDAEAGDRRRPHVLALGVDLRDAAGRERELREMVARDVYEAGFANLRRHLREGGDRRGAGAAAMPSALPLPSRQRRRAPLRRPRGPAARRRRGAGARAGEVRIRQRAIGVNYLDVYLRKGWIPAMLPLPGVPGMEAVGTVVDVGAGVSGFLPGDRVAYLGQAARRVLQRADGAGRVGRAPAARRSKTTSPPRRC